MPRKMTDQLTFRIAPQLRKLVEQEADRRGMGLAEYVRHVMVQELERVGAYKNNNGQGNKECGVIQ